MSVLQTEKLDLLLVEDKLWVLSKSIQPSYDFDFEYHFHCQRPIEATQSSMAVSRAGARVHYKMFYDNLLQDGVHLIHDPATHLLSLELPRWYPLITDFTPRSIWFENIPDVETIMAHFEWPIFVRGSRKTKHHSKQLSIIESADDYQGVRQIYLQDPVLRSQQFVCREFVPLRKVADVAGDLIPPSFEFRTFWWRGQLVGSGRYWVEVPQYHWTEREKSDAIAMAGQAAAALAVPFLVIDVGQQVDGQWIVIEVNDAQYCGYTGMPPLKLWQNILEVERAHLASRQ